MIAPRFAHDCRKCSYLGAKPVAGAPVDWYWCPGILGGTVIGRYGNDGPEYWSMPVSILRRCRGDRYADVAREMLTLEGRP